MLKSMKQLYRSYVCFLKFHSVLFYFKKINHELSENKRSKY